MVEFKEGDWIIATKPLMVESSGFGFGVLGSGMRADRNFMYRPIKVVGVTEGHILYEQSSNDNQRILPKHELQERGFIIAAEELVNSIKS